MYTAKMHHNSLLVMVIKRWSTG